MEGNAERFSHIPGTANAQSRSLRRRSRRSLGIGEYERCHILACAAIARRLVEAKNTIPHFYLTSDCAIDDLHPSCADDTASSDFHQRSCHQGRGSALQTVLDANVILTEEALLRLKTIDIWSLSTEVTPDTRRRKQDVGAISREISALACAIV